MIDIMPCVPIIRPLLLLIMALLISGCSSGTHPELRKTSGTVTYNGAPVVGATVAFYSKQSTRMATGRTDAEGRFQLSSYEPNDGAVPGEHTVVVTKVEDAAEEVSLSMDEAVTAKPKRQRPRSLLPQRYASQDASPLRVTVPEDGTDSLQLQLTDD